MPLGQPAGVQCDGGCNEAALEWLNWQRSDGGRGGGKTCTCATPVDLSGRGEGGSCYADRVRQAALCGVATPEAQSCQGMRDACLLDPECSPLVARYEYSCFEEMTGGSRSCSDDCMDSLRTYIGVASRLVNARNTVPCTCLDAKDDGSSDTGSCDDVLSSLLATCPTAWVPAGGSGGGSGGGGSGGGGSGGNAPPSPTSFDSCDLAPELRLDSFSVLATGGETPIGRKLLRGAAGTEMNVVCIPSPDPVGGGKRCSDTERLGLSFGQIAGAYNRECTSDEGCDGVLPWARDTRQTLGGFRTTVVPPQYVSSCVVTLYDAATKERNTFGFNTTFGGREWACSRRDCTMRISGDFSRTLSIRLLLSYENMGGGGGGGAPAAPPPSGFSCDDMMTEWSDWSECDGDCFPAVQTRTRAWLPGFGPRRQLMKDAPSGGGDDPGKDYPSPPPRAVSPTKESPAPPPTRRSPAPPPTKQSPAPPPTKQSPAPPPTRQSPAPPRKYPPPPSPPPPSPPPPGREPVVPGKCDTFKECFDCAEQRDCAWCDATGTCGDQGEMQACDGAPMTTANQCDVFDCSGAKDCGACVTTDGCGWCPRDGTCHNLFSKPGEGSVCPAGELLPGPDAGICREGASPPPLRDCSDATDCRSCARSDECGWCDTDRKCLSLGDSASDRCRMFIPQAEECEVVAKCEADSCSDCLEGKQDRCVWCDGTKQCTPASARDPRDPEVCSRGGPPLFEEAECKAGGNRCEMFRGCEECAAADGCGFCSIQKLCMADTDQFQCGGSQLVINPRVCAGVASPPPPPPPARCGDLSGCDACAGSDGCSFCPQTNKCVETRDAGGDFCQVPVDDAAQCYGGGSGGECDTFESRKCTGLPPCTSGGDSCTLSGGETVPAGWAGYNTGDDWCNTCVCDATSVTLTCTERVCADTGGVSCRAPDGDVKPDGWQGTIVYKDGYTPNATTPEKCECSCNGGRLGCDEESCAPVGKRSPAPPPQTSPPPPPPDSPKPSWLRFPPSPPPASPSPPPEPSSPPSPPPMPSPPPASCLDKGDCSPPPPSPMPPPSPPPPSPPPYIELLSEVSANQILNMTQDQIRNLLDFLDMQAASNVELIDPDKAAAIVGAADAQLAGWDNSYAGLAQELEQAEEQPPVEKKKKKLLGAPYGAGVFLAILIAGACVAAFAVLGKAVMGSSPSAERLRNSVAGSRFGSLANGRASTAITNPLAEGSENPYA